MPLFVLDASATIAGLSRDEANLACVDLILRVQADAAAAPALWYFEVANIFARKRMRGLLQAAEYQAMLEDMSNLRIECDTSLLQKHTEAASALALHHKLTVYDAAYLELAVRLKVPLATLDKDLARAARDAGVSVLP